MLLALVLADDLREELGLGRDAGLLMRTERVGSFIGMVGGSDYSYGRCLRVVELVVMKLDSSLSFVLRRVTSLFSCEH